MTSARVEADGESIYQRSAVQMADKVAAILGRLTFNGPIPIIFDAVLVPGSRRTGRDAAVKIELAMKTRSRDDVQKPAVIVMDEEIPLTTLEHIHDLEDFITQQAIGFATSFWLHEFDEWMCRDGKRIQERHPEDQA